MSPISTDRVFGSFPISIATSLALEGLFHTGEHEGAIGPLAADSHQALWINLRTLFRNAFYAFEDKRDFLTPEVMIESLGQDVAAIRSAVAQHAPQLEVVFYFCQMHGVNRVFPEAKFKNANTPAQLFYNALEKDTYVGLADASKYQVFDVELKNDKDTLIVTHLPMDLLWREHFPKLTLLESHTGKVKAHTEWYSKLNGKPAQLPFCKAFLTLFGDGVVFSPLERKPREVLLKVADKYKWNQGTTWDRINNALRLENEPHLAEFLRRLSR